MESQKDFNPYGKILDPVGKITTAVIVRIDHKNDEITLVNKDNSLIIMRQYWDCIQLPYLPALGDVLTCYVVEVPDVGTYQVKHIIDYQVQNSNLVHDLKGWVRWYNPAAGEGHVRLLAYGCDLRIDRETLINNKLITLYPQQSIQVRVARIPQGWRIVRIKSIW